MQKLSKQIRSSLSFHKKPLVIILATFGVYFTYIFSKMLSMKPEGLYAGHQNVWSDWALHISLTNIFANKPISEWFLYHPYYSGGKLTYGFLGHLISGLLMKLGLPLIPAMLIPSMILIILLLIGMYFLYFEVFKSSRKSLLGITIFILSSGLGFIKFASEFIKKPSLELILYPSIDYSRLTEYEWLAGNIPTAMLVPQRAFLIGITIGVWAILIFLYALKQKGNITFQKKLFITAGLFAGILPITHMHSFIAVVIITGTICFSHRQKYKKLIYFVTPAGLLSITLFFSFIYGGIEVPDFMRISMGWTSEKNILSWITMWLKLWGVMIPLVATSFYLILKNKKMKESSYFFTGFFIIFILGNIIIFQPTAWDNTKLFAWSYLGFSLLAADIIFKLFDQKGIVKKVLAIILIILLTGTGILELIRLQNFDKNTFLLSTTSDMELAQEIRENTNTDDIFLTDTSHNHTINMWASRPIFLGYLGWVRNFGFNHNQREKDLEAIYKGEIGAHDLIAKHNINYIYVGPAEINRHKPNIDFLEEFDVAFENENTKVYNTKKLLKP